MPKMPKIKMPNVGGNLKELGKKISGEVGSKTCLLYTSDAADE